MFICLIDDDKKFIILFIQYIVTYTTIKQVATFCISISNFKILKSFVVTSLGIMQVSRLLKLFV